MPPTRRPLKALGSLQLVGYANNPSRVITELAFIADKQANAQGEGSQSDVDTPLEVQFEAFMDGVNSRGKGTKTRQKRMTVEQAAAVLLVTVQKGHVELITKADNPQIIDVVKILPEAKKILAAFLPKLRGYGDIPYDQQYRGAIALAKRHFFPTGKTITKKELMTLLLQSYQEKRELRTCSESRSQSRKTLGVQTSVETNDGSSHARTASSEGASCVHPAACTDLSAQANFQNMVDPSHIDDIFDAGPIPVSSGADPDLNSDNHDSVSEGETGVVQPVLCTPMAPKPFDPYMTPVSNPRRVDHTAVTPSSPSASPTLTTKSYTEEDTLTADDGIGELLQVTAASQGRLNYYYTKFVAACQKITFLEGQKEEIQREFRLTKKKLDETEQRLREANADRWKLRKWVDTLRRQIDSIYRQLGLLRGMTIPESTDDEEWTVYNPELQGDFDVNMV